MKNTLIGYARCSTDEQDLTAQRQTLVDLGVTEDCIYADHGLTGTNRVRPGLDQAIAAMREGDTFVVPKLDRLARSVLDARAIADQLEAKGVPLALGISVYDPADPMGKMFFNILATFAEFESDLIRMRATGDYSVPIFVLAVFLHGIARGLTILSQASAQSLQEENNNGDR
ncbi:recombinase family protein [Microbulbifer sp. JMSA004]|uniref:recombinase family protein n=1 Tax=unclassified Microbulbifer TaxID=2619833 RepID=UPI00403ACDA1